MRSKPSNQPRGQRPKKQGALVLVEHAALVASGGDYAAARTIEFIELCGNLHTRRAYARAIDEFIRWCGQRHIRLVDVQPFHVARYMRELADPPAGGKRAVGLAPLSRKQHRAALSMWLNYLVINHVIATNPVSPVKGPRHSQTTGSTPVLDVEQVRRLFGTIAGEELADVRDRALIATMLFAWARVGAVTRMRVRNFRGAGTHSATFELHEKGGKYHLVPAHHLAATYVEAYLDAACLRHHPDTPLWQSIAGRSKRLSGKGITQRGVLSIVKRRCAQAGLPPDICNHSFRATAITLHQVNGGDLESARQLANHASIKTTQLYNRAGDKKKRAEVERVQF
jgi:site-specific recombinase XerD